MLALPCCRSHQAHMITVLPEDESGIRARDPSIKVAQPKETPAGNFNGQRISSNTIKKSSRSQDHSHLPEDIRQRLKDFNADLENYRQLLSKLNSEINSGWRGQSDPRQDSTIKDFREPPQKSMTVK